MSQNDGLAWPLYDVQLSMLDYIYMLYTESAICYPCLPKE